MENVNVLGSGASTTTDKCEDTRIEKSFLDVTGLSKNNLSVHEDEVIYELDQDIVNTFKCSRLEDDEDSSSTSMLNLLPPDTENLVDVNELDPDIVNGFKCTADDEPDSSSLSSTSMLNLLPSARVEVKEDANELDPEIVNGYKSAEELSSSSRMLNLLLPPQEIDSNNELNFDPRTLTTSPLSDMLLAITEEELSFVPSAAFSKVGIKLTFLCNDFVDSYGGLDTFHEMTTKEVCIDFIKPKTFDSKVSYCQWLIDNNRSEHVGDATVFISHAWEGNFKELIEALELHFREKERHCNEPFDDVVVWMDIFSTNQHRGNNNLQPLPFEWWSETFKTAIGEIGYTVMIFIPWDDPIPLTRAWCLFELYCTVDMECRFEVAMTSEQHLLFLAELERNPQIILSDNTNSMLSVHLEQSTCTIPEDSERIFQAVESSIGFEHLNQLVSRQLRYWCCELIEFSLNRHSQEPEEENSCLELKYCLALIYAEQGRYTKAEPILIDLRKRYSELLEVEVAAAEDGASTEEADSRGEEDAAEEDMRTQREKLIEEFLLVLRILILVFSEQKKEDELQECCNF